MDGLIDHGDWFELPADTLNEIVERAAAGFRRVERFPASPSAVVQRSRIHNYGLCVPGVRARTADDWRWARERLWAGVCVAVDLAIAASGKPVGPGLRQFAADYPRCGDTPEDVSLVIAFHAARIAGDQREFNAFATDWRRAAGAADEARIRDSQGGVA